MVLLESDKKDFSATWHSVNTVLGTLNLTGEKRETTYLKNFNNANIIIQKIENYSNIEIISSVTEYSIYRNLQKSKTRS